MRNIIPPTDFIVVFGTSHTVGECHTDDGRFLLQDQVWSQIISNKCNLPVVNLAVRGNTNSTMHQQLIDFF